LRVASPFICQRGWCLVPCSLHILVFEHANNSYQQTHGHMQPQITTSFSTVVSVTRAEKVSTADTWKFSLQGTSPRCWSWFWGTWLYGSRCWNGACDGLFIGRA
jgi:hypothetical protein